MFKIQKTKFDKNKVYFQTGNTPRKLYTATAPRNSIAMEYDHGSLRLTMSEPCPELYNIVTVNLPFLGKQQKINLLGLHDASGKGLRVTWCTDSRMHSGLFKLGNIYMHQGSLHVVLNVKRGVNSINLTTSETPISPDTADVLQKISDATLLY